MAGNPVGGVWVRIVDLAIPDGGGHDYRIEVLTPDGRHVLYGQGEAVTAERILADLGRTND